MGAMGMAIIYGLKVNLSVAIVAMLNHTNLEAMKGHGEGHGPSGGESDATEDVMCYNASKGSGNGKDTAEVD